MATNRKDIGEIDESFLLASIKKQGTRKVNVAVEPQPEQVQEQQQQFPTVPQTEKPKEVKESPKRKRNTNVDYGSAFLQRNEIKTRQCVYISQRIHATISEIVRVISDKDVTVGGYIDSILMEHLETHKDEINELYRNELSKKEQTGLIE